jgi:hypothetical protein
MVENEGAKEVIECVGGMGGKRRQLYASMKWTQV